MSRHARFRFMQQPLEGWIQPPSAEYVHHLDAICHSVHLYRAERHELRVASGGSGTVAPDSLVARTFSAFPSRMPNGIDTTNHDTRSLRAKFIAGSSQPERCGR